MGGIKYYHLVKDEELPDEFCAVRDVGGEPSEYVFYVPESENDKLRELAENLLMAFMVLETPKEQQECIDRAIELRHELNILPMETFDVGELGMEVDE